MARNRRGCNTGAYFVAFGGGLLACALLPTRMVIFLLAAALVLCGLSCGKR